MTVKCWYKKPHYQLLTINYQMKEEGRGRELPTVNCQLSTVNSLLMNF
ncbi:MAG: hypothetical protein HC849_09300 [Oscillatoriales cyanobacterium RU_3_3]|nr:hypothetical protein [Oscillatoriales cyanobacterium RU_3_3]